MDRQLFICRNRSLRCFVHPTDLTLPLRIGPLCEPINIGLWGAAFISWPIIVVECDGRLPLLIIVRQCCHGRLSLVKSNIMPEYVREMRIIGWLALVSYTFSGHPVRVGGREWAVEFWYHGDLVIPHQGARLRLRAQLQ
jgi:hypothetical protein